MKILLPHPPGVGGPGSFQSRFEKFLQNHGADIAYMHDGARGKFDLIMVVGGTKRLFTLLYYKLKGVKIIYRLDGINWLHRKKKVSILNYLTSEYRIFLSKVIHGFLADHIIYQSHFVNKWWDRDGFKIHKSFSIIYNGVDVLEFKPFNNSKSESRYRLICLEGTLDYSPYAIDMLNFLAENLPESFVIDLYGKFEVPSNERKLNNRLRYRKSVSREKVPEVMQGGIYLSMDVNAACPNAVIEALACGSPVVGFDTGALSELIDSSVGRTVAYGGNPWNLDKPDFKSLTEAIIEISDTYDSLSVQAREKAVKEYSISRIMNEYLVVMNNHKV
jgi:glycosyltransferase involved in cell wall biosynthesis